MRSSANAFLMSERSAPAQENMAQAAPFGCCAVIQVSVSGSFGVVSTAHGRVGSRVGDRAVPAASTMPRIGAHRISEPEIGEAGVLLGLGWES